MKRLCILTLAWLAFASVARSQVLTGRLIGTVRDPSALVLPGVTVTLTSPLLPGGARSAVTNEQGEYRFIELVPGAYSLNLTLQGFTPYTEEGLVVTVGGTTERNMSLRVGGVNESITVSGASPMVDTQRVAVTTTLPLAVIENIPTMRYGFHEYVKWAPGVAATDIQGNSGSASVLGSATTENLFLYEGVTTNDPSSGGIWLGGVVNAITEVQVVTLGASAEYQIAQGAVFNTVLKSGTNQFKGEYGEYWFSDSLISKPIQLPCKCPLGQTGYSQPHRTDLLADLGGPISKDRLWFFAALTYNNRKETNPGIDPNIPFKFYQKAWVVKGTWNINNRMKLNAAYHPKWPLTPPIPTQSTPIETITGSEGRSRMYASEFAWTLSNNTLLSVNSGGYLDPDNFSKPFTNDLTTPLHQDTLTGIACCGAKQIGLQTRYRWGQAAKLNKYVQGARVSQEIGFGVQFEEAGRYDFNALPGGVNYSDVGGQPNQATYRSAWVQGANYSQQGVWITDNLRLGGRVTVNLGVRWDRMHAVSPDEPAINDQLQQTGATIAGLGDMFTWNAVAPRTGVNVKLTDNGKTILRATYGRAYRPIFLNDFTIVHPGLSPSTLKRYNAATGGYTTIVSVTDPIANLRVDRNSTSPFTDRSSVGVDRELVANMGLQVTFVHKAGEGQIGWRDIGGVYGTQSVTLANGQTIAVFPLLNATSARIFQRTNGPGTFNRYNGAVVALEKRLSHRWQANVSYTFSKAEGLTTTQQDPNGDINAGGLLSTDRPHVFSTNGTLMFPAIDAAASVNLIAESGNPFSPQALVSLPQGTTTVNIAPADGSYRLDGSRILYLRYTQSIFRRGSRRLEVMAEFANVLQDKTVLSIVSQNIFSTTFNSPNSWTLPRRLYFSTAFKF